MFFLVSISSHPDSILRNGFKGKTLLMFVGISKRLSKSEAGKKMNLFHAMLLYNDMEVRRYRSSDHRFVLRFEDGSQAWEAKDILLKQEEVHDVVLNGKVYPGKNYSEFKSEL